MLGIVFAGIVAGLTGVIAAAMAGLPIWLTLLCYPMAGVLGSLIAVGMVLAAQATAPRQVAALVKAH